jgi:hypothetical protein
MNRRVKLPNPVAAIYRAVSELETLYPQRKFTPDGHLVGSIGEVVAAEALNLTLYPPSRPGHDAFDASGDVQIKMTAGKSVALYATCDRLVVLRVVSPEEAEIVYDGPGKPAWDQARKLGKNGQRVIGLKRLNSISMTPRQQSSLDEQPTSEASDENETRVKAIEAMWAFGRGRSLPEGMTLRGLIEEGRRF